MTISLADPFLTARIMEAVRVEAARQLQDPVPDMPRRIARLPGWTMAGAIILSSLVLIHFSKVVAYLRDSMGNTIDVSLGIILGIVLTIYISLLVGSNLPKVQRILRLRIR